MFGQVFSRLVTMFLNEVIVEKLANNRAFQQFAVRTHHLTQQVKKGSQKIVEENAKQANSFASDFKKEFLKNVSEKKK